MSSDNEDGLKLVHASLSRMGTMSIARAYEILGLKPHHFHALPSSASDFNAFNRAVDGKWPHVRGADPTQKPMTREEWDAVRGGYDFFTDFFAHFSPDIIRAYPEAKVVIVQRDFDSWWPSYTRNCFDSVNSGGILFLNRCLRLFQGVTAIDAVNKQYQGFFGVESTHEIDEKLGRKRYDEFFAEVRQLVPPERRLEFKVSDGWEPLCKFLNKPVPDVPFPRLNSSAEFEERRVKLIRNAYLVVVALLVGVAAVSWAMWTGSGPG